jgi:hypothetical protein
MGICSGEVGWVVGSGGGGVLSGRGGMLSGGQGWCGGVGCWEVLLATFVWCGCGIRLLWLGVGSYRSLDARFSTRHLLVRPVRHLQEERDSAYWHPLTPPDTPDCLLSQPEEQRRSTSKCRLV